MTNRNQFPDFLYGTAWKEDHSQALTYQALTAGFRGIDTANQRKHYFEAGVGLGIQQFLQETATPRDTLFLQTKFTFAAGQDHRKPYHEQDSFTDQVNQSFASSLEHLQTDYIDAYILHGPQYSQGLTQADLEVWQTMEALVQANKIKYLGVSNVSLPQLKAMYQQATVKPSFVQNRCFAALHWDQEIRQFCANHDMIYQGFSLLTANQPHISTPLIHSLAKKYHQTIPQIIFGFAHQVGMMPLTGTTSIAHMQEDLASTAFQLTDEEIHQICTISEIG